MIRQYHGVSPVPMALELLLRRPPPRGSGSRVRERKSYQLREMRKFSKKQRAILPDPVYGDQKVTKFVNHMMLDGKKNLSFKIFYNALDIVKDKMSKEEKTLSRSGSRLSRTSPLR